MPNWTSNHITIEGDAADIRAFLEAVKWEDKLFDFNRLIPMPELLKCTVSGFMTIDGKKVESWIEDKDSEGKLVPRCFTPEEQRELDHLGYSNWYDWAVANWGTKWNACHVDILDSSQCGYAEISFDTGGMLPFLSFSKCARCFQSSLLTANGGMRTKARFRIRSTMWRERFTEAMRQRGLNEAFSFPCASADFGAGETIMVTLPPNIDGLNGDRAEWARAALEAFVAETGVDWEDALGDLLADLMHLSDREPFDFQAALERGRDHHAAETGNAADDGAAFAALPPRAILRNPTNITIQIHRGLITDVSGLPGGFELRVEDYDMDDEAHPQWDAEKECIVTVYEGGSI